MSSSPGQDSVTTVAPVIYTRPLKVFMNSRGFRAITKNCWNFPDSDRTPPVPWQASLSISRSGSSTAMLFGSLVDTKEKTGIGGEVQFGSKFKGAPMNG